MSDWTEAVRKYEEAWTCHNYHYGWLVEKDKADAAIVELEAEVEALKCCVCGKPLGDEAIVVGWNPWNGTQAVHPECEPDYEEDHL